MSEWVVRPAGESDVGFIIAAWLRSYRERSRRDAYISDELYGSEQGQRGVIMSCMERSPCFVAELDFGGDSPELLGFLCGGGEWLHFTYVKKACRGRGICKDMVKAAGITRGILNVTHATGTWFLEALQRSWCERVVFNPYAIRPVGIS